MEQTGKKGYRDDHDARLRIADTQKKKKMRRTQTRQGSQPAVIIINNQEHNIHRYTCNTRTFIHLLLSTWYYHDDNCYRLIHCISLLPSIGCMIEKSVLPLSVARSLVVSLSFVLLCSFFFFLLEAGF